MWSRKGKSNLVFALGQQSTGRLETKRCFHLFQLPVVANPGDNSLFYKSFAGNNLHCQRAWELCLNILVADQLPPCQAVFPLRSQLCNVLPLLGRCRPPLPSSFSSHQQTGDQERQQDNVEPQHPEERELETKLPKRLKTEGKQIKIRHKDEHSH